MKKFLLILMLAFTGLLANASNHKKVAPGKSVAPIQSIELQSNMVLVDAKTPASQRLGDCYYLGLYHVYVDGVYWGLYDVYVCYF
jgi:hypothetical protein